MNAGVWQQEHHKPQPQLPTEQLLLSNQETLFPPCAAESSCSWCRTRGPEAVPGHLCSVLTHPQSFQSPQCMRGNCWVHPALLLSLAALLRSCSTLTIPAGSPEHFHCQHLHQIGTEISAHWGGFVLLIFET